MKSQKRIAQSAAIVSSGIMVSRSLGFLRDILIAFFFGTGVVAQGFFMAFTVPNLLRQLVAEGAVNTVIVPVLTEYKARKSEAEFFRFSNILFNQFFVFLILIATAGIYLSPFLIRIIAPGFISDPVKLTLTIDLTRALFPYIILVGLTAYCMGLLNTLNHFAAPAYSSALWNTTVIIIMLVFFRTFEISHLVLAVLLGGVMQLLLQVVPLLNKGPLIDIRAGFLHEGSRRIGRLLMPRVIGAGIYQLNIVVDRMLASLQFVVGRGAVAALYYGNRLFQLPLALSGIAIATAALPAMSSLAVSRDTKAFKESLSFSLRNMLFISLPASVGLMVLSRPIIKVIFERGEFSAYATDITSLVLFFYAVGLAAYGGVRILVSAFHAMQDTFTPVKSAFFSLLLNIVLNLILMVPLQAGGLALATSLAGLANFVFLYRMLSRRIGSFGGDEIARSFMRILAASAVMGFIAHILTKVIPWPGGLKDAAVLTAVISVSVASYLIACFMLKVEELRVALSWIKKR